MRDVIAHIHDLAVPPVLDVLGQWVHCRNARVATTSIDTGPLRGRGIIERRGRQNWEVVWQHIIVPNWDQLVLFTFVRNTWARVCSAFHQCRDRAKTKENKIDPKWQFTDWVKQVLAVDWPNVNMHFAPQYDSIYYDGKPIPGMFVGRLERIKDDWPKIASKLGVSFSVPHWNVSKHGHYANHYDDESRDIVGELYAPEIKILEYEFGQWA